MFSAFLILQLKWDVDAKVAGWLAGLFCHACTPFHFELAISAAIRAGRNPSEWTLCDLKKLSTSYTNLVLIKYDLSSKYSGVEVNRGPVCGVDTNY